MESEAPERCERSALVLRGGAAEGVRALCSRRAGSSLALSSSGSSKQAAYIIPASSGDAFSVMLDIGDPGIARTAVERSALARARGYFSKLNVDDCSPAVPRGV